jgi:hypothetical protein
LVLLPARTAFGSVCGDEAARLALVITRQQAKERMTICRFICFQHFLRCFRQFRFGSACILNFNSSPYCKIALVLT